MSGTAAPPPCLLTAPPTPESPAGLNTEAAELTELTQGQEAAALSSPLSLDPAPPHPRPRMVPEGREPLADREGESTLLSQSEEEILPLPLPLILLLVNC